MVGPPLEGKYGAFEIIAPDENFRGGCSTQITGLLNWSFRCLVGESIQMIKYETSDRISERE